MSYILADGREVSLFHREFDLYMIDYTSLLREKPSSPVIDEDAVWGLHRLNVILENLRASNSSIHLLERQIDSIDTNKEGFMDPANANNLPEAKDTDIQQEFLTLCDTSKSGVTTLDVKISLRNKGFWVNQADVSNAIFDYVNTNASKFVVTYGQNHRVYSFATITPVISTNTSYAAPAIKKASSLGDWQVYAPGGSLGLYPTEDFPNTTRNKARYAYSRQYDVPYVDTIARRL
jgi:hypothetical protein